MTAQGTGPAKAYLTMTEMETIVSEISALHKEVNTDRLQQLAVEIVAARHIFLTGAGRSGLMINAFANRLMHLGCSVSVVGEISSPHSRPGDLMIIGSGSGETRRLVSQAQAARHQQLRLAVITRHSESTLGQLADCKVVVPGGDASRQPMGSLFEQVSLLIYDSVVLALMRLRGETGDSMRLRHADIE